MESICFTKDHLMPFVHYKIHKNNQNYLCVITGPKVVEPALHTQVFCPCFCEMVLTNTFYHCKNSLPFPDGVSVEGESQEG